MYVSMYVFIYVCMYVCVSYEVVTWFIDPKLHMNIQTYARMQQNSFTSNLEEDQ